MSQGKAGEQSDRYRKGPVVIHAIEWRGDNWSDVHRWIMKWDLQDPGVSRYSDDDVRISTLEGTMTASRGDWIIRGVKGEFCPCKPDIFAATYEPERSAP